MDLPRETKATLDTHITHTPPRVNVAPITRDSPPPHSINLLSHLARKQSLNADDYFSGP